MTSKLTREELLNIIETDHVQCGEASALARLALAAMGSKPVAEVLSSRPGNDTSTIDRALPVGTQIYRHAQPATVVPDEQHSERFDWTLGQWAEHVGGRHQGDDPANYYEFGSFMAVAAMLRQFGTVQQKLGWNACRAAMLQAGNSPVIPDTWIPVSERVPEDEQEVLTINKMGHRFVSFFDKHSGLFFDRLDAPAACCIERVLVTHWMPLPAAPQEVKSES